MFIGLNPSTADETQDDPTVRRCIDFAHRWGFGGLLMTNLFAFRATAPADLKRAADPVGPRNDYWLRRTAESAGTVVAAWGVHGAFEDRESFFLQKFTHPLLCLGRTNAGHPKHPLYLRRNTRRVLFRSGQ